MNKLEIRISKMGVDELKNSAKELMDNFEDGSQLVFELILNELENKMNEEDFIKLMEVL